MSVPQCAVGKCLNIGVSPKVRIQTNTNKGHAISIGHSTQIKDFSDDLLEFPMRKYKLAQLIS